jgi:MHS family proline/betaine transporter-like MFS transporter
LLQGLCNSAEYFGILVYNYEVSYDKRSVGASNAMLLSYRIIGACIAAIIGAIINKKYMLNGGWRIPFLCAGIAIIIVFFIRLRVEETYDYTKAKLEQALSNTPYRDLLKSYKLLMCTGIFLSAFGSMTYCLSVIYGSKLFCEYKMSFQNSMVTCIPVLMYFSIATYCLGKFSDIWGIEKQVILGLILMLIASPIMFFLIEHKLTIISICFYMMLIITVSSITTSCCNALIAKYFPVECRYSGASVCDSFGTLLGSSSLFISLFLTEKLNSKMAIIIWVCFITIGSLGGVLLLRKRKNSK